MGTGFYPANPEPEDLDEITPKRFSKRRNEPSLPEEEGLTELDPGPWPGVDCARPDGDAKMKNLTGKTTEGIEKGPSPLLSHGRGGTVNGGFDLTDDVLTILRG
jgi:hypothetical protein